MNKETIYRTAGPAIILIALLPISKLATQLGTFLGGLFLVGSLLALVLLYLSLDPSKQTFRCAHCKKTFDLAFSQKLMSLKFSQKRHLTCPHCKKNGWATRSN